MPTRHDINAPHTRTAWLHVKTGNLYQIEDMVLREEDLMPLVMYHAFGDPEAPWFTRPWNEFFDGRFTQYNVDGVGGYIDGDGKAAKRPKTSQEE